MARAGSISTSGPVERVYVETGLPYSSAVEAFEAAVGRFDREITADLVRRQSPWSEVESAMATMAGPSDLMVFESFDQGAVAGLTGPAVRCRLYLVGNPAIAAQIVRIDPRASLYVPFRVAIHQPDQLADATISFDRPSSSLRLLGRRELDPIGQMLDRKIESAVQALLRAT
jgi:hypothetical protein